MLGKHLLKATQAPHTLVLREGRAALHIYAYNHFVRCNIICEKETMGEIYKIKQERHCSLDECVRGKAICFL